MIEIHPALAPMINFTGLDAAALKDASNRHIPPVPNAALHFKLFSCKDISCSEAHGVPASCGPRPINGEGRESSEESVGKECRREGEGRKREGR